LPQLAHCSESGTNSIFSCAIFGTLQPSITMYSD
jgi:hypothetical protein